jgi:Ser/Thr protein kinase RdoA (MazF antagonist)
MSSFRHRPRVVRSNPAVHVNGSCVTGAIADGGAFGGLRIVRSRPAASEMRLGWADEATGGSAPGRYPVAVNELVDAVLTRPAIGTDEAGSVLRRAWRIEGTLRPLPSERDRNFAVKVDGIDRFVLKVSNVREDRVVLEFQNEAMARLHAGGVPCQVPVSSIDGNQIETIRGKPGRRPLLARVLPWLPGQPLGPLVGGPSGQELLWDLGRVMGRTVKAFAGWDHPAAHRPFQWNALNSLEVIDTHAGAVVEPDRKDLVNRWRHRLDPLARELPRLRQGVIHNDANDQNVLVAPDGRSVIGILDLGDAVWSILVNELAVASAYAVTRSGFTAFTTIGLVRAGFETEVPLSDHERQLLVELVGLRLLTSVVLSAHQSGLEPHDPYLSFSERAAWSRLETLVVIPPSLAASRVAG